MTRSSKRLPCDRTRKREKKRAGGEGRDKKEIGLRRRRRRTWRGVEKGKWTMEIVWIKGQDCASSSTGALLHDKKIENKDTYLLFSLIFFFPSPCVGFGNGMRYTIWFRWNEAVNRRSCHSLSNLGPVLGLAILSGPIVISSFGLDCRCGTRMKVNLSTGNFVFVIRV